MEVFYLKDICVTSVKYYLFMGFKACKTLSVRSKIVVEIGRMIR